jgi:hypothetical protein
MTPGIDCKVGSSHGRSRPEPHRVLQSLAHFIMRTPPGGNCRTILKRASRQRQVSCRSKYMARGFSSQFTTRQTATGSGIVGERDSLVLAGR